MIFQETRRWSMLKRRKCRSDIDVFGVVTHSTIPGVNRQEMFLWICKKIKGHKISDKIWYSIIQYHTVYHTVFLTKQKQYSIIYSVIYIYDIYKYYNIFADILYYTRYLKIYKSSILKNTIRSRYHKITSCKERVFPPRGSSCWIPGVTIYSH